MPPELRCQLLKMEQLSFVVPFGVIGKTVTAAERRCPAPAEHERAGTPLYGRHGALRLSCLGGSISSLALSRSRLGATTAIMLPSWSRAASATPPSSRP